MTDPAEIERLEQRLRAIYEGDHERGCAGRTYDCSCGFDAATWATAKDAADALKALREENERLREALSYLWSNMLKRPAIEKGVGI